MKDTRYGRIKIGILVVLATLALLYFNLIKPEFEDRLAAAHAGRMTAERDAEDVAEIKSDPQAFDEKMSEAETEIDAHERRLGLSPDAVDDYVLEEAAKAGMRTEDVSIEEVEENPLSILPSVSDLRYSVSARGGYSAGIAFMRGLEKGEAAWSVDSFAYDDEDGGAWRIGLTLLTTERTKEAK
ncbi:MAG: hypothetical protein LBS67_04435 [Clostridiales Family XIII bacterium]|jgi:hypothetical protein|nr:hypothetical protein [Clostridiales Family XIII bacterium]